MRHPIEGTPYVPPNCPAEPFNDIPDLGAASFRLIRDPAPGRPSEIYGTFESFRPGEVVAHAEVLTGSLHLTSEDPLEQRVQQLMGIEPGDDVNTELKSTEKLVVDIMRLSFCERVANCRGVVGGECWALGAKAVQEVVGELLNVRTNTPKPPSSDNP